MRPRDDSVLLRDMLDYARRASGAVARKSRRDLEDDDVLAAALERFVEVIGEAAARLSPETRESSPQVPWKEIIALRNRLIHGYFAVDRDILWTIIEDDIPKLIDLLEEMI
jgi:uncharacterized protein with HEPN domain